MIKFRAWNGAIKALAQVTEIRFDQLAVLTTDSKFLWDIARNVVRNLNEKFLFYVGG